MLLNSILHMTKALMSLQQRLWQKRLRMGRGALYVLAVRAYTTGLYGIAYPFFNGPLNGACFAFAGFSGHVVQRDDGAWERGGRSLRLRGRAAQRHDMARLGRSPASLACERKGRSLGGPFASLAGEREGRPLYSR